MFNWDGVPMDMFDVYMEVGDVKALPAEGKDYVPIEVWVSCCSARERAPSVCCCWVRTTIISVRQPPTSPPCPIK